MSYVLTPETAVQFL